MKTLLLCSIEYEVQNYYRNIQGPKLLCNYMILFTLSQKHFYPSRNMYWCKTIDYDVLLYYRTRLLLDGQYVPLPLQRRTSKMPSIYSHKKLWLVTGTNHHKRLFSANRYPARAEAIRAMTLTKRRKSILKLI